MLKKTIKYVVITIVSVICIAFFYVTQVKSTFDSSFLEANNIYKHMTKLTSLDLEGRLAGSAGNKVAMEYISDNFEKYGVLPSGDNDTYYQTFETIIPDIKEDPIFTINGDDGSLRKSFELYKDYNILTSLNGGGVDFNGDIILVGSNLLRIPKELIKDKIVVIVSNSLNPKRVQYVLENGGKGILISADSKFELKKYIGLDDKQGRQMLVGFLSGETYKFLLEAVNEESKTIKYIKGIVNLATIKAEVKFPIIETSNVIGIIKGKSKNARTLMITANIDGVGKGSLGQYFQGALESTSGISTIIEVVRVIQSQKEIPFENIVLVGWNGQEQQLSGSKYYLDNPIFPLDKTTVIHIDSVGMESVVGLKISSDKINSDILRDKFLNYGFDQRLNLSVEGQRNSVINGFIDKLVPAIMVSDGNKWKRTYDDNMDKVNIDTLENSGLAVLAYLQRESYKDKKIDYLNLFEKLVLLSLFLLVVLNSLVNQWFNKNPNKKVLGISGEGFYYSLPISLNRKFLKNIFPYFVIVFLIVMLANTSSATNIKKINNEWVTNFSPYLLIKRSILYCRSMFDLSTHEAYRVGNVFQVIYDSSMKSIKLISSALILSTIVGIMKGLLDGIKSKKAKISSLGTLIIFSIPDVLIVLLGLLFYIFIAKNFPGIKDSFPINDFILPLVTLTIIPTIYISRITFIATQGELEKDYIKNAKAIGMSKFRIFTTELFPSITFTIVDTMPAIMAMLLTNMIIVEYLFNYNGIIYYLLYLYKKQDIYRFVPLALTLGIIYLLFTYGTYWIAKIINPLKREVKS